MGAHSRRHSGFKVGRNPFACLVQKWVSDDPHNRDWLLAMYRYLDVGVGVGAKQMLVCGWQCQ